MKRGKPDDAELVFAADSRVALRPFPTSVRAAAASPQFFFNSGRQPLSTAHPSRLCRQAGCLLTWGCLGQDGLQRRMDISPIGLSVSKSRARFHDLVVSSPDQT